MNENHLPMIAPSVLAADFGNLSKDIEMINQSRADWIHCDIMDGQYVPNISFGIPILKAIQRVATKPMDVHVMMLNPERYIEDFAAAGAAVISIHAEACIHLDRTLHAIRDLGVKSGVALNPSTPVDTLKNVLSFTDVVCLMSVNPGFGGQKFIPNTLNKVRRLRQMIDELGTGTLIEIDGGVDAHTAPQLLNAGADVLVAGSYVFKSASPETTIGSLKDLRQGEKFV
ncbi:ribulose-phosphate 3-epimerase [bacterium]|nr:ribulose-phosphate 3-epimerase [bacterium]